MCEYDSNNNSADCRTLLYGRQLGQQISSSGVMLGLVPLKSWCTCVGCSWNVHNDKLSTCHLFRCTYKNTDGWLVRLYNLWEIIVAWETLVPIYLTHSWYTYAYTATPPDRRTALPYCGNTCTQIDCKKTPHQLWTARIAGHSSRLLADLPEVGRVSGVVHKCSSTGGVGGGEV